MHEKNNESMATTVETFFVEEVTNLIHDNEALDEWNAAVEELGLKGQKTVVVKDKSPIPFLWMNRGLVSVFEELLPSKKSIEEFDIMPIPVDLLKIVSLCKREQYFDKIEVRYNEKQKDPAIIGLVYGEEKNGWSAEFYAKKYLIGRWADVKESLDALTTRAKAFFVARKKTELTQNIRRYTRELEDIELTANETFGEAMPRQTDMPF